MTGQELEIQELKQKLASARKQRDKYMVAYGAGGKYIKKLEKNYEIVVAHNLIHMKRIVEYQDYFLDMETNAYFRKLDKQHLLNW